MYVVTTWHAREGYRSRRADSLDEAKRAVAGVDCYYIADGLGLYVDSRCWGEGRDRDE